MKTTLQKLLQKLEKLNLPKDKFVVFGSAVLAAHGIRGARDLDLVVTRDLFDKLTEKFPLDNLEDGSPRILIDEIEIMRDPGFGFDTEEWIKNADVIDGVRFVRLEDLMEWKKKMGREKDLKDIKLIEDYLNRSRQV